MKKLTKKAEREALAEQEAFVRSMECWQCKFDGKDFQKESLTFQGRTIYFCSIHNSFQEYFSIVGQYWRRNGEQWQN